MKTLLPATIVAGALWLGCSGTNTSALPPKSQPKLVTPTDTAPPASNETAHNEPEEKTVLSAEEVAIHFWKYLGERNYTQAIALSSFPFDMDGAPNCIESASEMTAFFEEHPLPPNIQFEIFNAYPLDTTAIDTDDSWSRKVEKWTGPDARCITLANADATDIELKNIVKNIVVEMTFNGEKGRSLTRLRCSPSKCTVAGADN